MKNKQMKMFCGSCMSCASGSISVFYCHVRMPLSTPCETTDDRYIVLSTERGGVAKATWFKEVILEKKNNL